MPEQNNFTQIPGLYNSVLNDSMILEMNKKGLLIEGEINPKQVQPNSVDLTLGNTYKIIRPNDRFLPSVEVGTEYVPYIDLRKEIEYESGSVSSSFMIPPGEFILLASNEVLNIPNGILAFVQGRSSIARVGIQTEQAGLIDAGFRGTITFEVYNETPYYMALYPGMRIAQLYFFKALPADVPYGSDKGSKYANQIEATGSKIYMDPELQNDK